MPLVRISLAQGKSAAVKQHVSDAIHEALVNTFNVPADDRFHVISDHPAADFICTPEYLGVRHTGDAVFIQIVCNEGRSLEMKQALYRHIADGIAERTGIPRSDVIINLLETRKENWSFGNGIAHYALPGASVPGQSPAHAQQ